MSNAKSPASNITTSEKRALASLARDKDIIILPPDKGRCTVVLSTTDYDTKILNLLDVTNTYEKFKQDSTSSYKKVIDLLQKLDKEQTFDRPLYYRLYPREAIPCIYGLPKIHKQGTPLRPIVSSISLDTYNISKYLASILGTMVGNTPHHIQNSQDFAKKVCHLKLQPEETMVSYDVINYREGFYRQKHSCAMGSPVSPIVANLYMEKVEHRALLSFSGTVPSNWFRYVNDTWVKIQRRELEAFSAHLNKTDKYVKFNHEDVEENSLAFLDCAVKMKKDRNLSIEVYRKPTHTDKYLHFDSHHPLEHKLGVIKTLQHRAKEISATTQGTKKEQEHIKTALKTCGYPDWTFSKTFRKRDNKKEEDRKKRHSNSIPYLSGVSEKFRRILQKHEIPVQFKPSDRDWSTPRTKHQGTNRAML